MTEGLPPGGGDLAHPETGALSLAADWARHAAQLTPARVFLGRTGTSYRTADSLRLRADHAAARDAVVTEIDAGNDGPSSLTGGRRSIAVDTLATTRSEYLRRPDLGRRLSPAAREAVGVLPRNAEVQLILGDGLSARALHTQAPEVTELLYEGCAARGWGVGCPIVVRHCRVGILNDVGDLLDPLIAILLIGERPGLATAESLSAYLAYRPRAGCTDARRNLVSNIHSRGIRADAAAERILALAGLMRTQQRSGIEVKEPDAGVHSRPLTATSDGVLP